MADLILGKNACIEAIRGGRKIDSIILLDSGSGRGDKSVGGSRSTSEVRGYEEIQKLAAEKGIRISYEDRAKMDRMAKGNTHQGVIARAQDYEYSDLEDIVAFARSRGEDPFLVLLDGIEDPHNLGAIIRTAECCGVHGVVIPKNRSAAVNETVLRTSAGAAEHMRCAQVTNMARTIESLKSEGIWVYACDMGDGEIWDMDLSGAVAIVIGNEGKGVGRLVKEKCDGVISLPLMGRIGSLNASNAAAVTMYEVVRQRRGR